MKIANVSIVTGARNVREIDITEAQVAELERGGRLVQEVVPHLGAEDREFLISGITPTEWAMFIGVNE